MSADATDMISFPLASTGERFGVVRRFRPFIDGALESARLHAVTQPRLASLTFGRAKCRGTKEKSRGDVYHKEI